MTQPQVPIFDQKDPHPQECGVFDRIQIVTQPLGGTIIAWGLRPGFKATGPFHFYVDFGRSGTDEWETLNQTPLVDQCVFIDAKQRQWDHLADFYYRIRLVLPNQQVHLSMPQQANGLWCKRDWLIGREIIRKEYLLQRKRTNITAVGYILKRRRWGQVCKQCKEFDTGEVLNSNCQICYGTGFVGGYFKAIDFRITTDAPWQREFKRDPQIGNRNDIAQRGRAVAFPYLDTNDVYVRRDSGQRFYVNQIHQIVELGGVPLVVSVELRLAPATDIIYTVPLFGGSSSSSPSSSSSEAPAEEWRAGLNNQADW